MGAHLHAGPTIVVVGGGDHRHARHVEGELGKISHGRDRKPDVVHLASRGHEPRYQRGLHRGRIGAKIVAGHDLGLHAELMDKRAEAKPERLHAHEIDFSAQQPARVVFAKPRGFHQRLRFIGVGVGGQRGFGFGKHHGSYGRGERNSHIAHARRREQQIAPSHAFLAPCRIEREREEGREKLVGDYNT